MGAILNHHCYSRAKRPKYRARYQSSDPIQTLLTTTIYSSYHGNILDCFDIKNEDIHQAEKKSGLVEAKYLKARYVGLRIHNQ